jgi:hypothetical protein
VIVVPGSNTLGNVLNLIMGPESELLADIHGASVMDITEAVLPLLNTNTKLYISVSRCRNEVLTTATLRANKVSHISTFSEAAEKMQGNEGRGGTAVSDKPDALPAALNQKPNAVESNPKKCDYCGQMTDLVKDIPNVNICKSCIQIEIGCKLKKRV